MKSPKWTAALGVAALLASVPAAFATAAGAPGPAKTPPRIASARPAPASASTRPAPQEAAPGTIADRLYVPAERMADSIAEYYASGKMRIY